MREAALLTRLAAGGMGKWWCSKIKILRLEAKKEGITGTEGEQVLGGKLSYRKTKGIQKRQHRLQAEGKTKRGNGDNTRRTKKAKKAEEKKRGTTGKRKRMQ